jgi:ParB/RepB/Spo0J family partition protein
MTTHTIATDAIVASKTNPRKHFDKEALQELAESIGKHGVLQPILVRPNGSEGTYELVAGERRWRAAKIAQLDRIPATVRELADAEVLEIQVVENLQRADLHPLEEAEGYEALMKCQHADGRAYTADEIAAKVGKSRSYVYQRLKLTSLTPKAREAFYAGELDASRALLVARVPAHLQAEALEALSPDDYQPTLREARDLIRRDFMLDLKKPPFDVTKLYFAGKATAQPIGPACADCPKRTGNQPQLFEDVKSGDICTDPACFRAKTAAHAEGLAEQLRAKGHEVLTGEAARKVLKYSYSQPTGGYVSLETVLPGSPDRKTIKEALKAAKVKDLQRTFVERLGEPGQFLEVVKESAARQKLVEAGQAWAAPEKPAKSKASSRADQEQHTRDRELEVAIAIATHKALREAVREKGLDETALRAIVDALSSYGTVAYGPIGDLAGRALWRNLDNAPASELLPMLIDCVYPEEEDDSRLAIARHYGIDVDAIERQVREEARAKQEAEKAAKPAKAKKAKKREEVEA